ncbi:MAG: HEPN domain-containing protein [Treponema sp.]|jgi:HEPN domain-containing protein|nr:HEPN domain-containing protein [Treponema sp.]
MTNEEKYTYWLTHAQYDIDTAGAMLASGRWFYVVFMCQQAVEKLVKGLYTVYIDDNVPRVHNIKTLFERFEDKLTVPILPEVFQLFDVLSSHYLGSRYPDFMNDPAKNVSEGNAKNIFNKSKEVFQWLQTLKP